MGFKKFYEDEGNKEFKIFCDLDGVLVSWEKGFDKLSPGKPYTEWKKEGRTNKAWKMILDAGEDWWINLPWMEDGKKLFDFIKPFKPTILSSPGTKGADKIRNAKIKWIDKEIKGTPHIIDKEKQNYADTDSILIDDTEKNINKWNEAGGIGILHTNTDDTIKQLNKVMGLEEDLSARFDANSRPIKKFNKKKFFDVKKFDKKSHSTLDISIGEEFEVSGKIGDDYVEVFKNPSAREIKSIIKADHNDAVKLGITPDLDIYAWMGTSLHQKVAKVLNKEFLIRLTYEGGDTIFGVDNKDYFYKFTNQQLLDVLRKLRVAFPDVKLINTFVRRFRLP